MRCHRPKCDAQLTNCADCNGPLCPECEWQGVNEFYSQCATCYAETVRAAEAEFGWMRGAAKTANDARRDLDLPPSASDAEVTDAARKLK